VNVRAKILDSRNDNGNECFLSKMSIEDYVNALPSSYQEYDVQREIVSNVYLDHLVETVLNRRHIPPIVLVVDKEDYEIDGNFLEFKTFKILDGLQRTFRLQAIKKTIEYCCTNLSTDEDYLSWSKFQFSRHFSTKLNEFGSNTDVLRAVVTFFQKNGKIALNETVSDNNQWFEIWTGLSPQEEVRKMLMLNAGHKPVKTRHQLELLFLNLLPILREGDGQDFVLVREKEISATQFSKEREIGTFHFAHVITALLSFYEGKPVAPTTSLIQEIQSTDSEFDTNIELADPTMLKAMVEFLVRLDRTLETQYGVQGILWMGREVSLAGLFGALGAIAIDDKRDRVELMNTFLEICQRHPRVLNLQKFEETRNSLDLSKINIGTVNRKAISNAIKEIILSTRPSIINWKKHFGMEAK
jgi:hypothetical protein